MKAELREISGDSERQLLRKIPKRTQRRENLMVKIFPVVSIRSEQLEELVTSRRPSHTPTHMAETASKGHKALEYDPGLHHHEHQRGGEGIFQDPQKFQKRVARVTPGLFGGAKPRGDLLWTYTHTHTLLPRTLNLSLHRKKKQQKSQRTCM